MSGLLYLIPIALLLGFLGLLGFLWALRSGQFDDLDGAAERILFDDEDEEPDGNGGAKKGEGRE
jgi:cbb3-type cytochrome oxidase maturation protein